MKMELDLEYGLVASAGNPRLEWHGLRARLAAGHAARTLIERAVQAAPRIDCGSFDRGSARALAVYGKALSDGLGGINPTALVNGKPHQDRVAAVAGARPAGD